MSPEGEKEEKKTTAHLKGEARLYVDESMVEVVSSTANASFDKIVSDFGKLIRERAEA